MRNQQQLLDRIRRMPVIDAHEHLEPEGRHVAHPPDALRLYAQYTRLPMFASGLPADDWPRLRDGDLPLAERWAVLKPYIARIRHTSFARAARLTLQHFWGADELTDENIGPISERIAADNGPGRYRRVLREHCNIVRVLNQNAPPPDDRRELEIFGDQDLLRCVVELVDSRPPQNTHVASIGGPDACRTLDDYLDWARERARTMARGGAVGFKICARPYRPPDRQEARAQFEDLVRREESLPTPSAGPLTSYILDELLRAVPALGLPVAVHTGFWGDFREMDPTHMIPVIERHPDVHFDLFHTGIPYVRQTGLMAVNLPNTTINLCWAHSINASMTARAMDEYIDQVGVDKVIGFGGDVRFMVEKVYGHLELARRNIARVLARRIEDGLMDLDDAEELCEAWLFDNPARVYRLDVVAGPSRSGPARPHARKGVSAP